MKTLIATTTAALALLALAAGGASAKAGAPSCATEGKTLAKTSKVRVYRTVVKVAGEPYGGEKPTVIAEPRTYGCLLATRDRLRLDTRCAAEDVDSPAGVVTCRDIPTKIAIGGQYVAVAFSAHYDVRDPYFYDGTVWAKLGPKPDVREIVGEADESVIERLYVSSTGAVAYGGRIQLSYTKPDVVSRVGYIPPIRRGRPTAERVLDSGSAVSPKSLKTAGAQLTWKSGGKVRTAAFR